MSTPSSQPSTSPSGQNLAHRTPATLVPGFTSRPGSARNALFFLLVIVSIFVFWKPLRTLVDYSTRGGHQYDHYSHTLLIPFVSLGLVFFERRKIFKTVQYSLTIGPALLLVGVLLNWPALRALLPLGAEELLSTKILGLVLFWIGGFILCYGTPAFQAGMFALLFLLLSVPIPGSILDKPLTAVQYGSTEVCSLIFSLSGVPVFRHGTMFSLPDISVEVAKICSGIHSTLALFIVSLLAGHLFLSSAWRKVVLVLFTLPIVCITNGSRIAGLTLLAVYVDPSFMHGSLHQGGGAGFFLAATAILLGGLGLLRKGEKKIRQRGKEISSSGD